MTRSEALGILSRYRDWRVAHYDATPRPICPLHGDIDEALIVAIGALRVLEAVGQEAAEMASTRPLRW